MHRQNRSRPQKSFKRWNVISKKSFQVRFAVLTFITCFLVTMLVGVDIYFTINENILKTFNVSEEFAASLKMINNILFGKMLIYCCLVFAASFFISHRLAGPVYRFEQTCDRIGEGDLSFRVGLRKGDEFFDLMNRFNDMIRSLQVKVLQIDKLVAECKYSSDAKKVGEIAAEIRRQFTLH